MTVFPRSRVLSLGAGVQSTTLALLAIDGHIEPIEHAIFSDTGWEPGAVYEHLGRLSVELADHGIALHRVSAGNIRADALDPFHRFASMPLFVKGDPWTCDDCSGSGEIEDPTWKDGDDLEDRIIECARCRGFGGSDGLGMIRRQCTSEYKLKPIKEQVRRLLGATEREEAGRVRVGRVPGKAGTNFVENLVGISTDEVGRIRPSDVRYMVRRDPLVDVVNMSRADCLAYLADRWPTPVPRSSCVGCPFHSNAEWREMRDHRPDEWRDAVEFDRQIREGNASRGLTRGTELLGEAFLHADRVPLDVADIEKLSRSEKASAQGILFGSEGCNPFGCRTGEDEGTQITITKKGNTQL